MHYQPVNSRHPVRRSGFTLVELLVVIGIIALLISILLPSLNQARRSAMKVQCASIQREFATANAMYTNEEDGWYVPIKTANGTNTGANGVWYGTLSYIRWDFNEKYREMLLKEGLPQNTRSTIQWAEGWPEGLYCPESERGEVENHITNQNYAFNRSGVYMDPTGTRIVPQAASRWAHPIQIKAAQVRDAARKLQLIDAAYWITDGGEHGSNSDYRVWWDSAYRLNQPIQNGMVAYRHDDGEAANVQFFDGHVESMKKQAIHTDNEAKNRFLWDVFPQHLDEGGTTE